MAEGKKMTLKELETLITGSGRDTLEIHLDIVRDIGTATVVLFAVSSHQGSDHLELAGTGTLVTLGNSYWILTAGHVWEKKLKRAAKLGITLRRETNHRYLLDIDTIIPCGLYAKSERLEWGPDVVLLRVPPEHVGTIEANKVAFHLKENQGTALVDTPYFEALFLLGCPSDLGFFTDNYAKVEIRGFLVFVKDHHLQHGFDYLDVDAYVHDTDTLKSFGGVSGGGLWEVNIFVSPKTGRPEWKWRLSGVAFYQFPIEGTSAIIRCHGVETIRKLLADCRTDEHPISSLD
jgi:hypothetical protein